MSKVSARDVGPAIESDLQRNLGVLRIDQGRHDEATTALQRAVSIIEASFGAEHPRLTVVLVALGGLEAARGDFPGALAIQRRALDLLTAQLGEHHPRIAIAKINMGASLRMVGEYADAEALSHYVIVGELKLDGRIASSPGVLLAAIQASSEDKGLICPAEQGAEAAWAGNVEVIAAPDLLALLCHLKGSSVLLPPQPGEAVEIGLPRRPAGGDDGSAHCRRALSTCFCTLPAAVRG